MWSNARGDRFNFGWRRVTWHGAVWYVHTSGWYQTEHPAANPEEATRWLANFFDNFACLTTGVATFIYMIYLMYWI